MAITGPLGLIKLIGEMSVAQIREKAEQVPRLILCGTQEERAHLRSLLLAGSTDEVDRARLAQATIEVDPPLDGDEVTRSRAAQVLFTVAPPDRDVQRLRVPVFQVSDEESLQRAATRLADQEEDWVLSLGRHVPALRPAIAERLTNATAAVNAQISIISALPGLAPITGILLPPAAAADMVLLTKNQVMLVIKLAAVYGATVQVGARLWELAPVVGGAFGWRALARELVGMVPGGVGIVAKGTVAYAGTVTVGKAAQLYYARGQHMSRAEQKQVFRETATRARGFVETMVARLRREREAREAHDEEAA